MKKIYIYDATLREGNQTEDISLSVEDKLRITARLDDLGIDFIEGGWPSSNPKDFSYFKELRSLKLRHAKIAAFGSTAKPGIAVEADRNLNDLLRVETPVVTIFGKTWDLHIRDVLKITPDQNLMLVEKSVAYLKKHDVTVFFDAEHFFDAYTAHPAYALKVLKSALRGGADCLVLCDTNGGTLPLEIQRVVSEVVKVIDAPLGIHAHNDSDVAVANSLIAVACGCVQVQGTINGWGERCGNANLCSVIPNLKLKMHYECITDAQLKKIAEVSRFVYEIANLPPNKHQPFVGSSAFAHKAGVHVNAVKKRAETYEHVHPERVGNIRRVLVSDQAGRANILQKAKDFKINLASHDPVVQEILADLKELERQGFQFEGAEASFELRMRAAMGMQKRYFDLVGFRVIIEKKQDEEPLSEATIMVRVGGAVEHTAAMGKGPVNALDNALRKALEKFYPQLSQANLVDYKVRVLTGAQGTASTVRVLIETRDRTDSWGTVGVSDNIIEASWQALTDSITYKLLKDECKERAL